MTRPGPTPWAEDDVFSSGPDIGSDTKHEPLTVHEDEGLYRGYRPAPGIWNWSLNRMGLINKTLARIQACNFLTLDAHALSFGSGELLASCYFKNPGTTSRVVLFFRNATSGDIEDIESNDNCQNFPGSSGTVLSGPYGACVIDADGDNLTRRIVVVDYNNDEVYYKITAGAWTVVTFTAGAPGLDWCAVGCDRGAPLIGGTQTWLIGSKVSGGNSAVWSSTNGTSFAVAAGWPGATVNEDVRGIFHTHHHVGALGPSDPGNLAWLVLSDTYATRSSDGVTFKDAAHGLTTGTLNKRSAAYSRISGRWVVPLTGANFGDVAYSDDNGATWTTLSNVLSGASGSNYPVIVGDGHGTFWVAKDGSSGSSVSYWVSTDEGLTWTWFSFEETADGSDGLVIESCYDTDLDVNEDGEFSQGVIVAAYEAAGPTVEIRKSLQL